jgi:uncharacterized membrane protein YeaQ/YmgE (transglycosylase-associated protein family)
MSLLLAIIIGLACGALESFLLNKSKRIIPSMIAGLIGAVMGVLVGFVIGTGSSDMLEISSFNLLCSALGALFASFLFNLLARGYTDPNGPTELNDYDPKP